MRQDYLTRSYDRQIKAAEVCASVFNDTGDFLRVRRTTKKPNRSEHKVAE